MKISKAVHRRKPRRLPALATALGALAGAIFGGSAAHATSMTITGWSAETWGGGANYWGLGPDGSSVTYTRNSNPTVLTGGGDILNSHISFSLTVTSGYGSDDDFFGLVLGYDPHEINGTADVDFLLIDWKRATQPSGTSLGRAGLALSRVGEVTGAQDYWGHSGGVTELARGATRGSTGWAYPESYSFDLFYTATGLRMLVDGVEEFDLSGTFPKGQIGFYNNSQPGIRYSDLQIEPLQVEPLPPVPLPASLPLLLAGLGGLGLLGRRRAA